MTPLALPAALHAAHAADADNEPPTASCEVKRTVTAVAYGAADGITPTPATKAYYDGKSDTRYRLPHHRTEPAPANPLLL
jgi:hypothetical protein